MSRFSDLYWWELKKIWRRRITKLALVVMAFLAAISVLGDALFYNNSDGDSENINGYTQIQRRAEASRSISGRVIDDAMLDDMRAAIDTSEQAAMQYEGLYEYIWSLYGDDDATYASDAEAMYQERLDGVHRLWNLQSLTDGEKAYWQQKEAGISPFRWQYAEGFIQILISENVINMLLLFLLAICLPSVFAEEHQRKTDQLILCSRFGRQKLYGAKLLAGVTFGGLSAVLLEVITCVLSLWLYGADGFDACMQMITAECSWTMTAGQAAILAMGLVLVLAVLYSVLAMFLVKLLKNSVAVLGIMTGTFLLCLFVRPPYNMRVLARLYALLPPNLLVDRMLTNDCLYHVFGNYLTSWQLIPVVYAVAVVVMAWIGGRLYRRYQVTGR
ncbi:MAG: hypothetical protein Q4D42_00095 [Eubacteriales bacterium]|nr:hypothetical protein [Eubacteriales bacterium]